MISSHNVSHCISKNNNCFQNAYLEKVTVIFGFDAIQELKQ